MLTLVILVFVIPATFVVRGVVREAAQATRFFRSGEFQQSVAELLERHPKLASAVSRAEQEFDLGEAAKQTSGFLASRVGNVLGGSVTTLTQLVLMLFMLFFLYRDRDDALKLLHCLLPMQERQKSILLSRIYDTLYATLVGRLSIALIQGSLGAAMFWILGIQAPLLWGVVMSLTAMIPSVGTFLVWMPAAVYLFLSGHHWKAAILFAWGALVISTIDNILYPILVGSRLQLHTVAVMFSVLGGIALMGIPGIVLGPLILNVALTLISFWQEDPEACDETSTGR
jgi:predicted PurR-regulated permease PerM